jgi:putative transposase
MPEPQRTIITALLEQLITTGPESMGQVFTALFDLAMRLERERHLGAERYERSPERRGYANGYKPKTLDTPAGTLTVQVPKTRDADEPFYPQSLERGRRSCRAVMLAIAEMYVQGVSTRDAAKVMAEFGLNSLSSMQVSRAAALLDGELQAWRCRPLGTVQYLLLDARYEKVREGGVVRDAAILSAIGVDREGRRRVLGVSAALSEAEVHWRSFLDDLAVCAGCASSPATITPDCAPPAKPFSLAPSGSAASFIWLRTLSTTRRTLPSAKPSALNSAASGMPPPW